MRPAVAAEPAGPVAVQAAEADMRLPAELRASMPARALDQRVPAMERVQVLLDFMIGDDGLALRYREQPTLGIADSYRSREVNCLSFTLMFVAMARAAGIRAYAQASDEVLVVRVLDNAETGVMDEVVALAGAMARPGDTVLLSPGCASLDMFDSYSARGEKFAEAVQRYLAG